MSMTLTALVAPEARAARPRTCGRWWGGYINWRIEHAANRSSPFRWAMQRRSDWSLPCWSFAGTVVLSHPVRIGSVLLLLGWTAYHWRFALRHRVRFGMQVGQWGLAAWPFLMATAHGVGGVGLMLWPVLVASCVSTNSNEAADS
jgi:hypothetical protein